jgi:hypothetical protein
LFQSPSGCVDPPNVPEPELSQVSPRTETNGARLGGGLYSGDGHFEGNISDRPVKTEPASFPCGKLDSQAILLGLGGRDKPLHLMNSFGYPTSMGPMGELFSPGPVRSGLNGRHNSNPQRIPGESCGSRTFQSICQKGDFVGSVIKWRRKKIRKHKYKKLRKKMKHTRK